MCENSELAENSDLIEISLLSQMKMNEWMTEWVSERGQLCTYTKLGQENFWWWI